MFWQTREGQVIVFEPGVLKQPSSSMPRGMLWRLHLSLAGIRGCLSDRCARERPSLGRRRARILSQCRWTNPRQAACVLFKEMLKLRRRKQRHRGSHATSKHAPPPGGEMGLFGFCHLNISTWSHNYFFPSDRWMGQTLCRGECGLRRGDSISREKFPPSEQK